MMRPSRPACVALLSLTLISAWGCGGDDPASPPARNLPKAPVSGADLRALYTKDVSLNEEAAFFGTTYGGQITCGGVALPAGAAARVSPRADIGVDVASVKGLVPYRLHHVKRYVRKGRDSTFDFVLKPLFGGRFQTIPPIDLVYRVTGGAHTAGLVLEPILDGRELINEGGRNAGLLAGADCLKGGRLAHLFDAKANASGVTWGNVGRSTDTYVYVG
jgi:hypothetical protein